MNERDKIESVTADLFPMIHLAATMKELNSYKRAITTLLENYCRHFHTGDIIEGADVLEIGCGGRAAGIYALASHNPNSIQGIDLSPKNLVNTRKICEEYRLKNVTVREGNALNLDYVDNSFDLVFSTGVIHHTPDPYKCFQEMTRVLRPGGHAFLGIYGYGGIWGRLIHPLGMILGKIVPLGFMERCVNLAGFLRSQENSLLDWFYTPVQMKYKEKEIYDWYQDNGYENVLRIKSPKWFYNMGVLTALFFGDGYLYFIGRKKEANMMEGNA
jgi:ubiquinone/menaquinone biosynthesis C-methylase UbiE